MSKLRSLACVAGAVCGALVMMAPVSAQSLGAVPVGAMATQAPAAWVVPVFEGHGTGGSFATVSVDLAELTGTDLIDHPLLGDELGETLSLAYRVYASPSTTAAEGSTWGAPEALATTPVPEPAPLSLILAGGVVLGLSASRRRVR